MLFEPVIVERCARHPIGDRGRSNVDRARIVKILPAGREVLSMLNHATRDLIAVVAKELAISAEDVEKSFSIATVEVAGKHMIALISVSNLTLYPTCLRFSSDGPNFFNCWIERLSDA